MRPGERHNGCELVAIIAEPAAAVFERDFPDGGVLAYVGIGGVVATLHKPAGSLDASPRTAREFASGEAERILGSNADELGLRLVANGGEPSYESAAALLPPLESYTFLGTTTSRNKVIVWPDGRLGFGVRDRSLENVLFDPRVAVPGAGRAAAWKQGLAGRYLPVVDYVFFEPRTQTSWEEIAFATGRDDLETHVCVRQPGGKRLYWRLPGASETKDGAAFFQALLATQREWQRFFRTGMQLSIPDARVEDAATASIVRALISEVGLHPKYGAGVYWATEHDTFPPTTILLNLCLLDWGFYQEVRERLKYYLSRFVKADGTFDYYGPAISEYGQMLAVAVRYVRVTGDTAWLNENLPALKRIAGFLLSEITAARSREPEGSPLHGLLWGSAEADTREDRRYYFSSDLWCWRGLVELGRLLRDDPLLAEAAAFQKDVTAALGRAYRTEGGQPFLPPVAGLEKPFERMTESEFASYTNYRYWPEMLSAGLLTPALVDAVIGYRATHGGEVAGTTRLYDHMDDWPYAHYAWGLLESGHIEKYLLGFYGHLAYHQTPGTFTACEQVAVKGGATRGYEADYCVPAQLVTPQMLRWMIAWEPWDREELWLARAAPRAWFAAGFSASRIPTRFGPASISIVPGGKAATVELDRPNPGLTVHLRLPLAGPTVRVEGTKQWQWNAKERTLDLRGGWKRAIIRTGDQ